MRADQVALHSSAEQKFFYNGSHYDDGDNAQRVVHCLGENLFHCIGQSGEFGQVVRPASHPHDEDNRSKHHLAGIGEA